jgi:hypothetical protein
MGPFRRGTILLLAASLPPWATPVLGQPPPAGTPAGTAATAAAEPDGDPARASRRAVLDFMAAVSAGDREALRGLIHARTGAAQSAGLSYVIDCVVWQRALERAAVDRWGTDAAAALGYATNFSAADVRSVEQARVEVRERENLVVPAGGAAPIPVRQTDGRWRVVLRAVSTLFDDSGQFRGERGSETRLRYLDRVRRAIFHAYWRVREGRVASADAARTELQSGLAAAAVPDGPGPAMEPAEQAEFDRTAAAPPAPQPPGGGGGGESRFNRAGRG